MFSSVTRCSCLCLASSNQHHNLAIDSLFLCERKIIESDAKEEKNKESAKINELDTALTVKGAGMISYFSCLAKSAKANLDASMSKSIHIIADCSVRPKRLKRRSAAALIGAFKNFDDDAQILAQRASTKTKVLP